MSPSHQCSFHGTNMGRATISHRYTRKSRNHAPLMGAEGLPNRGEPVARSRACRRNTDVYFPLTFSCRGKALVRTFKCIRSQSHLDDHHGPLRCREKLPFMAREFAPLIQRRNNGIYSRPLVATGATTACCTYPDPTPLPWKARRVHKHNRHSNCDVHLTRRTCS